MTNLFTELQSSPYHGRGIVIGKSADSMSLVCAYFIMGRSENSRNRVFLATNDGIKTAPFDETKVEDPSLIIYNPVKTLSNKIIVTNGSQTDTIFEKMSSGETFENSLKTSNYEPDAPIFTPRISGIMYRNLDTINFKYTLSIIKKGNTSSPNRFFFQYGNTEKGIGHFIHTYDTKSKDRLVSFSGEPKEVNISGDIDTFTEELWTSLNNENKISLFVRFVSLETGEYTDKIVNKYS